MNRTRPSGLEINPSDAPQEVDAQEEQTERRRRGGNRGKRSVTRQIQRRTWGPR